MIHLIAAHGSGQREDEDQQKYLIQFCEFWKHMHLANAAHSIHACTHILFQRSKCWIIHSHKVYLVNGSSYPDDLVRLSSGGSFMCPSFLALSQVPLPDNIPLRVFTISFRCIHGFLIRCYLPAYPLRIGRNGVPNSM
jgi:hypothetical protein